MIPSKKLFVGGERDLTKGQRFGRLTGDEEETRQIAARAIGVWMLRAERVFAYRQRAL